MALTEIFQFPTVKKVIFQIRFPNLFYLDSKIGDFQMKIMKDFPKSGVITRKQFIVANYDSNIKSIEFDKINESEEVNKIWQFKDTNDTTINILSDSVDISSTYHKTYNNIGSNYKFRDIVKKVIDNFIDIVKIPIISRIGLRYIDVCPIIEKNNEGIKKLYNSVFPYKRFDASEVIDMKFRTTVKKSNQYLHYSEDINPEDGSYKLILNYDGFALDINTENYLAVLDSLHDLVADEFQNTLKKPIIEYMRTGELK